MIGGGFTDPARISRRIQQRLQSGGVATPVTLRYQTITGGELDPVTQSVVGGSSEEVTVATQAFVHFLQAASFVVREFAEVEAGDAMADFPPDLDLEGKDGLVFEFNGAKWTQKPMTEGLAQHWDTVLGGQRLLRSVLLRKLA